MRPEAPPNDMEFKPTAINQQTKQPYIMHNGHWFVEIPNHFEAGIQERYTAITDEKLLTALDNSLLKTTLMPAEYQQYQTDVAYIKLHGDTEANINARIKPVGSVVIDPDANKPLTAEQVKEKEAQTKAYVEANIKRGTSPDGQELLGKWISDGTNKGHSWNLNKDGSVQHVSLSVNEGSQLIVKDYPKGTLIPSQMRQTDRDASGKVLADILFKPDNNGQMVLIKYETGKLMDLEQKSSKPTEKHISQGDSTFDMNPNAGQLASSRLASLKIAEDIPEQHHTFLQSYINTKISSQNNTVEIQTANQSPILQV